MDLKTLRSELRQLSEMTDGWSAPRDIAPIERELALEKLRRLYETLRFGGPESDGEPAGEPSVPVPVPLSIDLDEVISLDSVIAEASATVEAAPAAEDAAAPATMSEPASEAGPASVFEELTVETVEPPVTELPDPEVASGSEDAPEPEVVSEVVSGSEETPGPEEDIAAAEPKSEHESGPDPKSDSAPIPVSAPVASDPASDPAPDSEPVPQPVAPTLFGIEEHSVRHRHRQRVIMSLYDTEPAPKPAPKPASVSESQPAPVAVPVPEPMAAPVVVPAPEPVLQPGTEPAPKSDATADQEIPPVREDSEPEVVQLPSADSEGDESRTEVAVDSDPARVAAPVLGEVINHDVRTLSDTIAPPRDVASELRRSEPVTDLRRAVGINDKFLLIRDLFGGDGAAYEVTIRRLNECETFDDAMIYIAENFAWNPNSDGAKLIMDLLERKFA